MTLCDVNFQSLIIQHLMANALNPQHAARCQIRCGPATFLVLQELVAHGRAFESEPKPSYFRRAADRKHFATHFPNMAATPLHHMGAMRQGFAEFIKGLGVHFVATSIIVQFDGICAVRRHFNIKIRP